jgi:hypothetical protein
MTTLHRIAAAASVSALLASQAMASVGGFEFPNLTYPDPSPVTTQGCNNPTGQLSTPC